MTRPGGSLEESICVGCGLCCDGTLHGTATVRPEDEQHVTAAGLVIEDDGKRRFFFQPCARFSCGSCSVYAVRPQVCRRYRCALLIDVEAGDISSSVARERIATAMELRAKVRNIDPKAIVPAERSALAVRLRAKLNESQIDDREACAKALLATASLEHFLNRWFLKSEEEKPDS